MTKLRITVEAPEGFEPFNPRLHDGMEKRYESAGIILEAIRKDDFTLEEMPEESSHD